MLELIPHRNEMLWIDEVLSSEAEGGRCQSTITSKKHYISNGQVRISAYIELQSQAFCLSMGTYFLNNKINKIIKNPMLVGVDELLVNENAIVIGDEVIIEVKLNRKIDNIYFVQGKIKNNRSGIVYCEAGIRLYAQVEE